VPKPKTDPETAIGLPPPCRTLRSCAPATRPGLFKCSGIDVQVVRNACSSAGIGAQALSDRALKSFRNARSSAFGIRMWLHTEPARDVAHRNAALNLADGPLPELAVMTASGRAASLVQPLFPEQASIAARLQRDAHHRLAIDEFGFRQRSPQRVPVRRRAEKPALRISLTEQRQLARDVVDCARQRGVLSMWQPSLVVP
jgi:hypothetical protein